MILGTGIDIVSISRIEKLLKAFDDKFIKKIYTLKEINIAKDKNYQGNIVRKSFYYAKRFAAKEALSKALGTGIGRGINFNDIEITNNKLGKPQIKILNQKQDFIKKQLSCKNFAIHLTLSDEKELAIASVIIEEK